MRLDHEFTVPAPVDKVWQAVLDPERVAPCMPGATLSEVDGDTFKGSVKVKLGPVNLLYKGSGEFQDKDEQAHKVAIKASGKDARGAGTASATVTLTLTSDGNGGTKGSVATDLNVTGRPAQFGRGMISDVGGKILDSFAASLAEELGGGQNGGGQNGGGQNEAPQEQPDTATATQQQGQRPLHAVPDDSRTEAIDLMEFAGSSVVKRLIPVLAGAAVVAAVFGIVKAVRRNRG